MTTSKIRLQEIKQFGNEIQIFWHQMPDVDEFFISTLHLTENGYGNEKIINKTVVSCQYFNLNDIQSPFLIKIVAKKDKKIIDSKEVVILSDAIGEGKKLSFHFLNDSFKQIFSISAIIIAGSVALLPFISIKNDYLIIVPFFFSIAVLIFTAGSCINNQLYLVNETSRNRFNIHRKNLIHRTWTTIIAFTMGILLFVFFLGANYFFPTKSVSKSVINIEQDNIKVTIEGLDRESLKDDTAGTVKRLTNK